jgi:hypothetical protein
VVSCTIINEFFNRCTEFTKTHGTSESGLGGMDWIQLAGHKDRWRAIVNAIMNRRVPHNAGNFLTSSME